MTGLQQESGPLNGGTAVTVSGSGFPNTAGIKCRLAEIGDVFAIWESASRVVCHAPSAGKECTVSVEFSGNGQDFTADAVAFRYSTQPSAFRLMPSTGPVTGYTAVTISGLNFQTNAAFACRIGEETVPAISVVNNTTAVCMTKPVESAQCVVFRVANNGAGARPHPPSARTSHPSD